MKAIVFIFSSVLILMIAYALYREFSGNPLKHADQACMELCVKGGAKFKRYNSSRIICECMP